MDWKQFFASIIGSIAWPSAIIGILIIFRVQVGRLISQIRKIGAGGVNVELAEQVEIVRSAGQVVEAEQVVNPLSVELEPATLQLAKRFPVAAFTQSFKQLEGQILRIRSRMPEGNPHRGLLEVLQQLHAKDYISSSVVELFLQLRKARNAAMHGKDEEKLSPGEAVELIQQVKLLEDLLRRASTKLPPLELEPESNNRTPD